MTELSLLDDLVQFYTSILSTIRNKNMKYTILGRVQSYPIILLSSDHIDPDKKSYLIAAGFHGNEIAGTLGLLKYIETEKYSDNLSFLPLMNPTGYMLKSRFNYAGDSPNTGYIHPEEGDHLSEEGTILMNSIESLIPLAKDGFLTLHEDYTNDKFYLYYFGENSEKELLDCGGKVFGIVEDGFYKDIPIKNGLVANRHDGTFEDLMFHKGIKRCVCTETPANANINQRIVVTVELIKTFVKENI
jgi:predicted deacylase